jgi:hypothetical protein
MIGDTYDQFPPLALVMSGREKYRVVRTVREAAETLLSQWPIDDGEEYISALLACLDAHKRAVPPRTVRDALIRAANEVRISHISVVC